MSKEVDQRIVEMQFNNADFEQKVSKSISSLKQLKDASQMEDAGKGLENLTKGISNLDLSHIADSIDKLNARFSNLGIVGMTVMQNLTNAAMGLGKQLMDTLTEAPRGGMQTYESFISATKQLKNTAKDAEGLPVTLDAVNKALDELNDYSDKTIYSFNDMTANIGKFTNAGVSLEDSVTAIKGISNVAASAGASTQNAAAAMYNFGQALSSGVVKNIDWKSIETANMSSIEFKNQLIQTAKELGTVRQEGDKWISTTYSGKKATEEAFDATHKFNESLAQQWMTSEVLIETLRKYASETDPIGIKAQQMATEVNTFSQMMSVFAESQKTSWSKTWRYIFGDYEESKQLWTGVLNGLNWMTSGFNKWRNDFFQSWHDLGGRNELFNALANIWRTVQYYVDSIGGAFGLVFDEIDATPLVKIAEGFEDITAKFAPAVEVAEDVKDNVEKVSDAVQEVVDHTEEFNELVERIKMGEFGNGEERIQRLKEAGYAYENLQNAVNGTLDCEKRYETTLTDNEALGYEEVKVTNEAADAVDQHTDSVKDLDEATKDLNPVTANLVKILMAVKSTVGLVSKGVGAVWGVVARGASVLDVIKAGLMFILNIFGSIAGKIYEFTSWAGKFKSLTSFIIGLGTAIWRIGDRLGVSLTPLKQLLYNIASVMGKVKKALNDLLEPLKGMDPSGVFKVLLTVLKAVAAIAGGVLLVSLNLVAAAINTVVDYAKLLWNTLKNLSIVKNIAEAFKSFKAELKDYKDQLKQAKAYTDLFAPAMDRVAKAAEHLKELFGPIIQRAFDAFVLYAIKAAHAFDALYNAAKKSKTWQSFTNLFLKFKLAIKDIPELIAKVFESLQKNGKLPELKDLPNSFQFLAVAFNNFKDVLTGNFTKLFQDLMEKFRNGFDMLGKVNFGPFQGLVDNLKSIFNDLKKLVLEGEGTVGQLITNVWGKLSQIDFRGGAITALIGAVALFAVRWSKVGKSASFALKGLGDFFRNGGQVATTAVDKFNGFLKIAAAIAIIAGSIWLIAEIPADRFASAVGTIAGAFAVMFGAIELLAYQKIPEDKMKAIGMAFIGLGAGLAMVAIAAKIFAGMEWEELKKGGAALVVFTVMVVAAARAAKGVGKGAGIAFIGLSAALLMLIPSIKLLAGMDAHTLIKGGVAVFAFVNILAKAANRAGKAKGSFGAFMGLSLGLLLLIPSIKILSGMDAGTLIKGGLAVYAFLNIMAGAAKKAQGGAKGFLGMGIAIGILALSLKLLSTIPWSALLSASMSLRGVLKTVTDSMVSIGKVSWGGVLKTVVALALVLGAVGGALYLLTKFTDTDQLLKAALGVSAILLAFSLMGPTIATLSAIPFMAGVQAALNAMMFFGALILCLEVLGEVASLGDGRVGEMIESGSATLGRIIHNFLDGLLHGDGEDVSTQAEKTVTLADKLSAFGDSIQGFLKTLQDTDYEVIDKAKALAMAILTITAADLVDALAGWIRGEAGLDEFANSIVPLTEAVITMNEKLENVEIDTSKIDTVVSVVNSMADLAKALPKKGGWAQKILGVQELATFAKDMQDFLTNGFRSFVIGVDHLGEFLNFGLIAKIGIIQNVTKVMIDLAKSLPENGVISKFIDGPKDLGKFAANMCSFMADEGGFQDFAAAVNAMTTGVNLEMLKGNIIPATQEMINLGAKLKEGGSILDFITGRTDLGKFGERLAAFGTGISQFAATIEGVDIPHINSMTEAMERLADLNVSKKLETSLLGTFASCITTLGAAVGQFYVDTGAADPKALDHIIGQIANLHNLMLILTASQYDISNFAESLRQLGETSAKSFIDSFTEAASDASEAATGLMNSFLETIDTFKHDIEWKGLSIVVVLSMAIGAAADVYVKSVGKTIITKLGEGVDSKKTDVQSMGRRTVLEFCAGVSGLNGINGTDGLLKGAGKHMVDKAIEGIEDERDRFEKQGNYSAEGYAEGIRDMAWEAAEEAARMVRDAAQAAADAQKSASPSKVYMGLGKDGIDGYILGFVKNTSRVVKAVTSVGKAGISAMQKTIDKTLSLVDGNLDYEPTITPVMDLSELTTGVQQANMLLGDIHTDDLAATTAATIANAHNEAIAVRSTPTMNYSKDLTDLIENTNKIINAVKQNRYAIIDGDEAFRYFDRRLGMA